MRKTTVRILAILLVALLTFGLISSALAMVVWGAPVDAKIITGDTTVSRTMTVGKVATGLTIRFSFLPPVDAGGASINPEGDYDSDDIEMPPDSSFGWSGGTELKIEKAKRGNYYEATLTKVSYNGSGTGPLQLSLLYYADLNITVPIPGKYFKETDTTDGAPTSDIIVQSTTVRDAGGKKMESMDKKTGPCTVEVVFYDLGLGDESDHMIDAAKKYAFITTSAGFKLHKGSSGTVERMSSTMDYPRFKATFEGIESTETGNTLGFRVQYDFEEYEKGVKGEAVATLFQVKTESEDEDDEIAPLKPNLIIQEYSYGGVPIVAGEEFSLDLSFRNTSGVVGVENVVMTIEPGSGFVITAASNTVYFPGLAQNETMSFSVGLRANPAGDTSAAADYSVNIKFSYQYLSKKEYAPGESGVIIAIPVTQLDRFGVDEITDYSQYLTIGEEGYVTVPVTNKGKSLTYNITGEVKSASGADYVAAPVHFGNLEPGKSGAIDISITINTPGVFEADAVITYEDENMKQKELSVPFSIMVMEPMPPQTEMPPGFPGGEVGPQGPGLWSIIFCAAGAVLMAVPLSLYLIKRVKAKGSEDADEDF